MAVLGILGVVASCLGPAIEIGKLIAAPIRRHCSYLCCLRSNIKTLEDEAKSLDDATSDLQGKVDVATNDAQRINSQVETWLKDSVKAKTETKEILDEAPDVGSGCSTLGKRYSLSKKAKQTTIAIKKLVETSKFTEISHPPPPAASAPVESGTTTHEFESRREIEEEIIKSLGDKNVTKIGICGMGGLGKTTMAEKIMKRAFKEELFGEVVMTVVSQPVDKLNIQLQIAGQLDLKFKDDVVISRANLLRERLKGRKRTLLVLDDVWESLDMAELGIPCEDGCKVLITSRDSGVFKVMGIEKVFELKILDEKEAWILFRGKAGTCVDDAVLNPIAEDVMRECKGLPIALATVGVALKDEREVSTWEDALGQLRRSNPAYIPSIIEQVYNPLKLSYDRLDTPGAKSMFLLCCLFPEDYHISLEHLAYFATGLHLFEDIGELKEVRGRTSVVIKMLKTRGLLLDGYNVSHVRMHDIARDVSIFIASNEGRVKCSDCTWISSHLLVPPLLESSVPQLELLLMNGEVEQKVVISKDLIRRSTELKVLFIQGYRRLRSIPELCTSVVTLVLSDCKLLESIAFVGKLKSLEILICRDCGSIKELPEQVRGLKRLKLLEISDCYKLERVAAGVISSLVGLEELKIVGSFNDWKGDDIEEEEEEEEEEGEEAATNAGLREIESLKKLRCLEIEVSDIESVLLPLRLSSELVLYSVQYGQEIGLQHVFSKRFYGRRLSLNFEDEDDIDWDDLSTNIFLTRTEYLVASGWGKDFNLNLAKGKSIRWLALEYFTNEKNIASAAAAFPLLEFLCLKGMDKLEEIWDDDAPIPSNSFNNLKRLHLADMQALKRMGKSALSIAKDLFLQAETIVIKRCAEIEHLVMVPKEEEQDKDSDGISTVVTFPKLKSLFLYDVPKLRSLICSRGIESIQFPVLSQLEFEGCENLKWLVSRDRCQDDDDDDSLHLLCHPKVSFGKVQKLRYDKMESKNVWCSKVRTTFFTGLVELNTGYCNKIRRLFSSSSKIPQNLVSLQLLRVYECKEMVTVIEDDKEEEVSSSSSHTSKHTRTTPLFPSLQELRLSDLPKLESFCELRYDLDLPSLKILRINKCDEMKSFNAAEAAAGSRVIARNVQSVAVDKQDLEYAGDLNATLHQHFEKAKREKKTKIVEVEGEE